MKYRIYFNLHKKCFSIQHYIKGKGYRLLCHQDNFIAIKPTFKVYVNGRNKVLKEKQKNVHAYILTDNIILLDNIYLCNFNELLYNPYRFDYFFDKDTEDKIGSLDKIYFSEKKCCYIN